MSEFRRSRKLANGVEVPMPEVTLLTWTQDAVKAIHALNQNMFGDMIKDLDDINLEDAYDTLDELKKTSIMGALEAVDFLFQVDFVPRSFTAQATRKRVGATYSEQSLRFTVLEDGNFTYSVGPTINTKEKADVFVQAMENASNSYAKLLEMGVSTEDARGVLPLATNTKIGIKWNFATLIQVASVRLCYQSQSHWLSIVQQMKDEIAKKVSPKLAEFLVVYCQRSGKCGYKAKFDRECPIEKTLTK